MERRAIFVMGLGNSGAAAVTDLLSEVEGVVVPRAELFLLHHPDGIMTLEDAIVRSWSVFGPDWALRRFRALVDVMARRPTRLRFGLDYEHTLCPDFRKLAEAYADSLVSNAYDAHFMFRRAEMSRAEYFAYLCCLKFDIQPGKRLFAKRYSSALVIDPEVFLDRTRAFTSRLLDSIARGTDASDVALLQAASPFDVARSSRYFARSAAILVDRDPRDVYISALSSTYMPREVNAFIAWYQSTRDRAWKEADAGNALRISFEQLVTRYDEVTARIFEFLGIDPARHTKRKTRLVPERSAARLKKWQKHPDREAIHRIERELEPYLWSAA